MAHPHITISIVNWATAEDALACLDALGALTYRTCRIVVIDNASRDDSVDRIRSAWPEVTVLRSDSNRGYAGGHALGLAQAQQWHSDAVWLLNPDARPESDALDRLVAAWSTFGDALYGGVPLRQRSDGRVCFDFPSKFLDASGGSSAQLGYRLRPALHFRAGSLPRGVRSRRNRRCENSDAR